MILVDKNLISICRFLLSKMVLNNNVGVLNVVDENYIHIVNNIEIQNYIDNLINRILYSQNRNQLLLHATTELEYSIQTYNIYDTVTVEWLLNIIQRISDVRQFVYNNGDNAIMNIVLNFIRNRNVFELNYLFLCLSNIPAILA